MTSYHGGKQKIGKAVADAIYDSVDEESDFRLKGYCEPFCGMLGVYQHIMEMFDDDLKYTAGDVNESVIKMWKAAQRGWTPPTTCTRDEYMSLKGSKTASAESGFLGHQSSYLSSYFNSYVEKNALEHASRNVMRISELVKDVKFKHGPYSQFSNLKGYIIYCDPPYVGTETRYSGSFDPEDFQTWCTKMSKHNLVFLSEYTKPPGDTVEIWRSVKKPSIVGRKCRGSEKLFMYV